MAIRKVNGHAVTGVLPASADAVQVGKANVKFRPAPKKKTSQPGTATITRGHNRAHNL